MQTMHLVPGVAIQPNIELNTRPKQVLGSLPLAFALPGHTDHSVNIESKDALPVRTLHSLDDHLIWI